LLRLIATTCSPIQRNRAGIAKSDDWNLIRAESIQHLATELHIGAEFVRGVLLQAFLPPIRVEDLIHGGGDRRRAGPADCLVPRKNETRSRRCCRRRNPTLPKLGETR